MKLICTCRGRWVHFLKIEGLLCKNTRLKGIIISRSPDQCWTTQIRSTIIRTDTLQTPSDLDPTARVLNSTDRSASARSPIDGQGALHRNGKLDLIWGVDWLIDGMQAFHPHHDSARRRPSADNGAMADDHENPTPKPKLLCVGYITKRMTRRSSLRDLHRRSSPQSHRRRRRAEVWKTPNFDEKSDLPRDPNPVSNV
jgi:hypothetical protein